MQLAKQEQAQLELAQQVSQGFSQVMGRLDAFDTRLSALEKSGPRPHEYRAQNVRGIEAQIDPVFGVEIAPVASRGRAQRVVKAGEAVHIASLLERHRAYVEKNTQLKAARTGLKVYLWVAGYWDKESGRERYSSSFVSLYTVLHDAVEADQTGGQKLSVEQKSAYEQVLAICHQKATCKERGIEIELAHTFQGATSAVHSFLKANC